MRSRSTLLSLAVVAFAALGALAVPRAAHAQRHRLPRDDDRAMERQERAAERAAERAQRAADRAAERTADGIADRAAARAQERVSERTAMARDFAAGARAEALRQRDEGSWERQDRQRARLERERDRERAADHARERAGRLRIRW